MLHILPSGKNRTKHAGVSSLPSFMHKSALLFLLGSASSVHIASAAILTFDEPGIDPYDPLSGLPGWIQSEQNPDPTVPLAWITEWTRSDSATSNAVAIGGIFDVPLATTFVTTYEDMVVPLEGNTASISFDVAIIDSTNAFPGRDSFAFTVSDLASAPIFHVEFRPVAQTSTPGDPLGSPGVWQLLYTPRGGSTIATDVGIEEGGEYSVTLDFGETGVSLFFTSGATTTDFFAVPSSYNTETESLGGVSFGWTKPAANPDFGDNYMLIDNLTIVPEPGSLAFTAFAMTTFLFRRRRTSVKGSSCE